MLAALNNHTLHGDDYKRLVASHHLAFPGLVMAGAGVALILLWVLLGQIQSMSKSLDSRRWKQMLFKACKIGGYSMLGLGAVLLLLLTGLPRLASWLDTGGLRTLAAAAVGAAGVLASVGRILRSRAPASRRTWEASPSRSLRSSSRAAGPLVPRGWSCRGRCSRVRATSRGSCG